MTNSIFIATSLDGYIATKNGGIDWLMDIPNPEKSDFGYADFMKGIDALVMGRHTFEKVLSFDEWPYDKPVFVVSTTLKQAPITLKDKASIITETPQEICSKLAEKGFTQLYIDGGKLIQSFLAEDLIDEMTITRIPILLGEGIPLFGHLKKPLKWILKESQHFNFQLVQNRYQRHP